MSEGSGDRGPRGPGRREYGQRPEGSRDRGLRGLGTKA